MELGNCDFCFLYPSERNKKDIIEKVICLVNGSQEKPYNLNFDDVTCYYSDITYEASIDEFSLNYTVYFCLLNNFTVANNRLIRQAIYEEVRLFLYRLKKDED